MSTATQKLAYRVKTIYASSKRGWGSFSGHTKVIIIILVALVVGSILIFVIQPKAYQKKQSAKGQVLHICSDSILQQAVAVMGPGQQKQFLSIVNNIKQIPKFDQDPNCLYVLLNYYVVISDAKDSRTYLDKFKAVYVSKASMSPILIASKNSLPFQTVGDIDTIVQFLEKADRENTKPKFEPGKHE